MRHNHIIALFAALTLTATVAAQDEYRINQQIDNPFSYINIGRGWHVRLVQEPAGTPTVVEVATRCPEYFEEGKEPELVRMEHVLSHNDMNIVDNTSMPRMTLVELHTSQPVSDIIVQPGSRLTIAGTWKDTLGVKLHVRSRAEAHIDTLMAERQMLEFQVDTASKLGWDYVKCASLYVYAEDSATLREGTTAHWGELKVRRRPTVQNRLTQSDTARHLKVTTRKHYASDYFSSLSMSIGVTCNQFSSNLDNDSPYKSNFSFGITTGFSTNIFNLTPHLTSRLCLNFSLMYDLLRNDAMASGNGLAIDDNYGGRNPWQELSHFDIALPLYLDYRPTEGLWMWFGVKPLFRTANRLVTHGEKYFDKVRRDIIDVYRPFNIQLCTGLGDGEFLGWLSAEFYIDLLPTFNKELGLGNIHQMGLRYNF